MNIALPSVSKEQEISDSPEHRQLFVEVLIRLHENNRDEAARLVDAAQRQKEMNDKARSKLPPAAKMTLPNGKRSRSKRNIHGVLQMKLEDCNAEVDDGDAKLSSNSDRPSPLPSTPGPAQDDAGYCSLSSLSSLSDLSDTGSEPEPDEATNRVLRSRNLIVHLPRTISPRCTSISLEGREAHRAGNAFQDEGTSKPTQKKRRKKKQTTRTQKPSPSSPHSKSVVPSPGTDEMDGGGSVAGQMLSEYAAGSSVKVNKLTEPLSTRRVTRASTDTSIKMLRLEMTPCGLETTSSAPEQQDADDLDHPPPRIVPAYDAKDYEPSGVIYKRFFGGDSDVSSCSEDEEDALASSASKNPVVEQSAPLVVEAMFERARSLRKNLVQDFAGPTIARMTWSSRARLVAEAEADTTVDPQASEGQREEVDSQVSSDVQAGQTGGARNMQSPAADSPSVSSDCSSGTAIDDLAADTRSRNRSETDVDGDTPMGCCIDKSPGVAAGPIMSEDEQIDVHTFAPDIAAEEQADSEGNTEEMSKKKKRRRQKQTPSPTSLGPPDLASITPSSLTPLPDVDEAVTNTTNARPRRAATNRVAISGMAREDSKYERQAKMDAKRKQAGANKVNPPASTPTDLMPSTPVFTLDSGESVASAERSRPKRMATDKDAMSGMASQDLEPANSLKRKRVNEKNAKLPFSAPVDNVLSTPGPSSDAGNATLYSRRVLPGRAATDRVAMSSMALEDSLFENEGHKHKSASSRKAKSKRIEPTVSKMYFIMVLQWCLKMLTRRNQQLWIWTQSQLWTVRPHLVRLLRWTMSLLLQQG